MFVFVLVFLCSCLRAPLFRTALNRHAIGSERDLNVAPHALEHRHPSPQQLTHDHLRSGHRAGRSDNKRRGELQRDKNQSTESNSKQTAIAKRNKDNICTSTHRRCVKVNGCRPRKACSSLLSRRGIQLWRTTGRECFQFHEQIPIRPPSCVWRGHPQTGKVLIIFHLVRDNRNSLITGEFVLFREYQQKYLTLLSVS